MNERDKAYEINILEFKKYADNWCTTMLGYRNQINDSLPSDALLAVVQAVTQGINHTNTYLDMLVITAPPKLELPKGVLDAINYTWTNMDKSAYIISKAHKILVARSK